jgi:drug/metabolite transporter (DMT)-like permease
VNTVASPVVRRPSTRTVGITLAFGTALVSGVSIFVNGHAVKHFDNATVYTTAKNAVAGVLLLLLALSTAARPTGSRALRAPTPRRVLAFLAVAVVGGSVPFVLFFEGLARAEATQAAFIQKTLVVWVALLAVPLLRERVGTWHVLAVVLLIAGQAWIAGDAGTVVFGAGETMILLATLLWSVEVILVKRLLEGTGASTLAAARLGIGTGVLFVWLAVTGRVDDFVALGGDQWRWALLTGLLLTAYVATWYAALARAPAVDVTAVLVFGAVVTALLSGTFDGAAVSAVGTILIAAGAGVIGFVALRPRPVEASG